MMKYEYRSERFWYKPCQARGRYSAFPYGTYSAFPAASSYSLGPSKLEDRGPVFISKARTKTARFFEILKFRSMIVDAEKGGKSIRCRSGDSPHHTCRRVTSVNCASMNSRRLLTSLKGDMSIGSARARSDRTTWKSTQRNPRVFLPGPARQGGLTGYAQIYGKYNTEPYDKLRPPIFQYIEKQSILPDLKLILL